MSTTEHHQDLVERHFEGTLTPGEQEELERLLLEDSDVQKDFNKMKLAIGAIRSYGFREMLEGIRKEYFPEDCPEVRPTQEER